jgi:hypothetical protein
LTTYLLITSVTDWVSSVSLVRLVLRRTPPYATTVPLSSGCATTSLALEVTLRVLSSSDKVQAALLSTIGRTPGRMTQSFLASFPCLELR